jgi:putative hemolysin
MSSTLPLLFTTLFLTFASGWCSASEAALFSLSSIKIKSLRNSPRFRERLIAKLMAQPRDLLVTLFLLNTLVNILLQNVISHAFMNNGGWLLVVGLPFVLLLVFGEIIPKYIGIQNNFNFSKRIVPTLAFLQKILYPIRKFIIYILTPISRLMFFFLKKDPDISHDELQHVLKKSQEAGVITHEEQELIWGYVDLQDSSVREIMRPRQDILYYDINDPLSKLIHLFVDKQCTRLPVCEKDIENVIGILDAKSYFLYREEIFSPPDVRKLLLRPYYIPETTSCHTLLKRLDESAEEIALVVDEYGSISGLITYEDLVEVVVGKISDSRDQKALFTQAGKNEIIASGKMELEEFNRLFDAHLKSEGMITLGGWLTEQLGEIPKSGTKFENGYFLFQVLAADPNRIRRIYIRKLDRGQP